MKISRVLSAILAFSAVGRALGQVPEEAASKIASQINALMSDYTDTTVIPTNLKDAVIVLSTKVLQSEKVTSLWTFVSACAVGKYLNDNPSKSLNSVCFADPAGMRARPAVYCSLPASIAKSVQSRVYAGEIDVEEGQRIIMANLKRKSQEIH